MMHPRRGNIEGSRGFTLIELMVVVAIIGFLAGWVAVDFGGITDEQRLHTTVRAFVGMYRTARNYAAKERRECVLQFDIERHAYRLLVYPRRNESGHYVDAKNVVLDQAEQDELIGKKKWSYLERDVFISDVEAPGGRGNDKYTETYWLQFRQDGTIPPHIIHFVTKKGLRMSLEIEEITGTVTVKEGHTAFYSPREEEFNFLIGTQGGASSGK